MDVLAIVNTVVALIQAGTKIAPIAIDGIANAKVFATQLWQSITGEAPTGEQEAQIDALLAALTSRLEEPLPLAQPGDPDYIAPTV